MRALFVLALLLATPSQRHWVEINSDTQRTAGKKLDELQREGDPGRKGYDAAAFKNARLDDPLYYYASDASFASFATDASNDLMPYLVTRNVVFPVVVGNDAIGMLLFKTSLGSTCYFGPVPPELYQDFKAASRRVRLEGDQRLSIATTGVSGDYLIVEDGTAIYRMAPCSTRTLRFLGIQNQFIDDFQFVTPAEMGPMIKRAMRGAE